MYKFTSAFIFILPVNDNIKIIYVAFTLYYFIKNGMKLLNAIEEGLNTPGSKNLIQDALSLINGNSSKPLQTTLFKKLKDVSGKKGIKANKVYIKKVSKMLAKSGIGLSGLSKKNNAIIGGGILGAAAGLFSVYSRKENGETHEIQNGVPVQNNEILENENGKKILNVALFTVGGILAGAAVKKLSNNKRIKKWVRKNKSKLKDIRKN